MQIPNIEEWGLALLGFGGAITVNLARKRPIFARIHTHVIGTVTGYMIGGVFRRDWEARQRRKRIYMEDYMRLHPEDFVEPETKLYKDVLEKWYPVRG